VPFAGVTEMETSAGLTVRFHDPFVVPTVADTEHWPVAAVVNSPPGATVATLAFEVLQLAELVKSCVVPLLYEPVAFIC
jgi:hypothetical protein